MSDPLSVSASVISIIGFTLQSVQFLAKTIDAIKEAPAGLKSIRSDLDAVTPVLQQLQDAINSSSNSAGNFPADQLAPALQNCDRACTAFRQKLDNWTRHSSSRGGAVVDRWKLGILGQDRIQTLRGQLGDCKATLTVVLSTATFITLAKSEEDESEKKLLLQSREQKLHRQLAQTETMTSSLENRIQEMDTMPSSSTSLTTTTNNNSLSPSNSSPTSDSNDTDLSNPPTSTSNSRTNSSPPSSSPPPAALPYRASYSSAQTPLRTLSKGQERRIIVLRSLVYLMPRMMWWGKRI